MSGESATGPDQTRILVWQLVGIIRATAAMLSNSDVIKWDSSSIGERLLQIAGFPSTNKVDCLEIRRIISVGNAMPGKLMNRAFVGC